MNGRHAVHCEDAEVPAMVEGFKMEFGICAGCFLGVVAERGAAAGEPIRKRWEIATMSAIMRKAVNENTCPQRGP